MIQVNGEQRAYQKETIQELLEDMQMRVDTVVVERNREIVPKDQYDQVQVQDNDVIEIVTFKSGG